MYNSKIAGLGKYLPDNVVTNDDLSKIMDTTDEWIIERTGIKERRHIKKGDGDTTASMGVKAAKIAIEKANNAAFLNVVPVKLGCGSWECRCNFCHSVPFTVKGKAGSVTIEILPAPKGLGLVAGGKIRNLLKLAGVKHAWTRTTGSTATMSSTSKALLECLRQTWSQGLSLIHI